MRFPALAALLLYVVSLGVQGQRLTITHATVVDVQTGKLRPNSTVVVEGKRITAVASYWQPSNGQGTVLDAKGRYLIPGLWDMHTHVFFDRTAGDGRDYILPMFVAFGITGVRDMGSALDPVLAARRDIADHRLLGPRMVVSGPMLDGPSSTYKAAIAITTPASGRAAVDMLHGRGVDFIKVQSGVPREAYFAIANQAKRDGIAFEGHVPDAIRASEAVGAGQRTFEHLIGIFEASSPDEDAYLKGGWGQKNGIKTVGKVLATFDASRERKIIDLLAEKQVWQCPTLFWERGQWLVDSIDFTKDPDLAYAPKSWVTTMWPKMSKGIAASLDTDPLPVRTRFVEHELGIVHRLQVASVPFLAGTDTPAGVDVLPGISLHRELERFVAAGFTPLQALQTATINPAKFLGRQGEFGSVASGKTADLVLLDRNPLVDIRNTRSVFAVVVDGQYVSHEALEGMRGRLRDLAKSR